jgi:DNA repair exonuclease SbcCD ATPase subunit
VVTNRRKRRVRSVPSTPLQQESRMTEHNVEGIQSYPHDRAGTVSEIVDSFTNAIDAPESACEPFAELVKGLASELEETSQEAREACERVEELEEENESLRDDLEEERERRRRSERALAEIERDGAAWRDDHELRHEASKKWMETLEDRIDDVEEPDTSDETPTPDAPQTTIQQPETPLEDVIRVPEHLVEDSLTANQERARFVAKDVHEYTRSVPAGRAIKSSELRRVLSAHEDESVYTETVSRVIRYLDDLGADAVDVKETQSGERVVVFADDLVKRIVAYHNQSNSVVTGEEVSG